MGLRRQAGGEPRPLQSDPEDEDYRDHVALDPEHRLIISVVPGARTIENTEALVRDFHRRTGGRLLNLITTDDYPAEEAAILHAHGETVRPPRTGKAGRPRGWHRVAPAGLSSAVVERTREKGRVVRVGGRVILGTPAAVARALGLSPLSRAINTAFIERGNGTDHHRCAWKARRSDRWSKDWRCHEAATYLSMDSDNFCWAVRTLAWRDGAGHRQQRPPAMAAGLTDHVRSMSEWL